MTTRLITNLTRQAVSTAAHVVRHPVGTATQAVTLAKGFAELGLDLVGGSRSEKTWTTPTDSPRAQAAGAAEKVADTLEDVAEKVAAKAEQVAGETDGAAQEVAQKTQDVAEKAADAAGEVADEAEDAAPTTDEGVHHDDLPGADVVARAVPEPDELPEPIVIEADDDAAPLPAEESAGPAAEDEDPVVYTSESTPG